MRAGARWGTDSGYPDGYRDFVTHVVPELQRRGLFRKEYSGPTLRDHLGLAKSTIGDWRPASAAE